mmetsp:Transcript_91072/g.257300  ORF Transcript_91072/g.257300 Transcript_91072/m.257300 type:complete len:254 (-) Transcript_91072:229-990(-)
MTTAAWWTMTVGRVTLPGNWTSCATYRLTAGSARGRFSRSNQGRPIWASGRATLAMVWAHRPGPTVPTSRENGARTAQTASGGSCTPTATSSLAIGRRTPPRASVSITIRGARPPMAASGSRTCSMDTASSSGQVAQNTTGSGVGARRRATACMSGQTVPFTPGSGKGIRSMATDTTPARTGGSRRGCGRTHSSTVAAGTRGPTDVLFPGSTQTTRSRASAFSPGRIRGALRGFGTRASSTATASRTSRLARS